MEIANTLPGDLQTIADIVGIEGAVRIADACRGTTLYIHGLDDLRRHIRDRAIRQEYDSGVPVRTLARRNGLGERAIRKVLQAEDVEVDDKLAAALK